MQSPGKLTEAISKPRGRLVLCGLWISFYAEGENFTFTFLLTLFQPHLNTKHCLKETTV